MGEGQTLATWHHKQRTLGSRRDTPRGAVPPPRKCATSSQSHEEPGTGARLLLTLRAVWRPLLRAGLLLLAPADTGVDEVLGLTVEDGRGVALLVRSEERRVGTETTGGG